MVHEDAGSGTLDGTHPSGLRLEYAFKTQRGHYPEHPDKANQDTVFFLEAFAEDEHQHLMGVMDGHGETGAECALFARMKVSPASFHPTRQASTSFLMTSKT